MEPGVIQQHQQRQAGRLLLQMSSRKWPLSCFWQDEWKEARWMRAKLPKLNAEKDARAGNMAGAGVRQEVASTET